MGGGIFLYIILLFAVIAVHCLYFGDPLQQLWFKPEYLTSDPIYDLFGRSHFAEYLRDLGLQLHNFEIDVIIGALLGLTSVGLSRWISAHFLWAQRIDTEFSLYFQGFTTTSLTLLALSSSLVEEVVFRGWLQGFLGLTLTSILFGLLHIPPQRNQWPWTLSALVMGFALGSLYEWRGSVTAPFIVHFTINFFNLQALARLKSSSP